MKKISAIIFLFIEINVFSQETKSISDHFTIEGKVTNQVNFNFRNANDYTIITLDSFVIYNHLHERKRAIKNIKGILLTDILKKAGIDEKNPKLMSEFYFTCIAVDGYKVVFSWNEIFNTDVGKGILVVTEADGMKEDALPDKMLLLSSKDYATGRRFVKGLEKIIVDRVK